MKDHRGIPCLLAAALCAVAVTLNVRAQEVPSKYQEVLMTLGKQGDFKANVLKINIPRTALMNQAHTVIGSRGRVIPGARRSMVVTVKFSAVRRDAAQKIATLTSQSVMPEVGAVRKAMVMPKSEATVAQKESRFSKGKAISRAPIWRGRK